MKLESEINRIHGSGAELIALSVDDQVRQIGMHQRWPLPNALFVSDPGGEQYLKALGLYSPDERDGIAIPALLVIAPDGTETFRYTGNDFADRVADEEMFAAVEALGLEAIEPPEGGPEGECPDDVRGYFRPVSFNAYVTGSRTGALALSRRVKDPEAKAQLEEHVEQMTKSLAAWAEVNNRE